MKNNNIKDEFSEFFQANYFKVKKYAYGLLKSEPDAEDVAQEVFIKLWTQQKINLTNEKKANAYLLTITRNIALNILKHQQVKLEYQNIHIHESESYQQMNCSNFLPEIYYQEMLRHIYTILETVPKRRRSIYKLSRFKGKSHKEIAYKMNISVHTVERQVYLTQIKLKKALTSL